MCPHPGTHPYMNVYPLLLKTLPRDLETLACVHRTQWQGSLAPFREHGHAHSALEGLLGVYF